MISVENLSKAYGNETALHPTTLRFLPHRTTILIGPSGCGKSTLLRLLVGLISPDSGEIRYDDKPLTAANVQELRYGVGYVVQDGGLFPHLTIERNIALVALYLGRSQEKIDARLAELAELVQLPRTLLNRFPRELSGGQRQRASLMRALMLDPAVLLLDEPLGALDPITRSELQRQLKEIFGRLGKTVILVTHDMGEAAFMGDQIILMQRGQIIQNGSLTDLLTQPAAPYVTEFISAQRSFIPEVPKAPSA